MNLRLSMSNSGYTEDSAPELDSPAAMQTASLAFRAFHQGLDDFGNSLVIDEQRSFASSVSSRRSRSGSMWSESTTEDQIDRDIALVEYVSTSFSSLTAMLTEIQDTEKCRNRNRASVNILGYRHMYCTCNTCLPRPTTLSELQSTGHRAVLPSA